MRTRCNSSVKLDLIAELVQKTLFSQRDPITGLFYNNDEGHAWIRDNLYATEAVWALFLAYRKTADLDEDKSKTHEYKHAAIQSMRSLLMVIILHFRVLKT